MTLKIIIEELKQRLSAFVAKYRIYQERKVFGKT